MNYLTIKNWSEFQHYKDRNPPWIKLSTTLFQDYEFSSMSDASKLLAVCLWTLASRDKDPKLGRVPDDIQWIKKQCGLGETITDKNLQELESKGYIFRASNTLATCKQNARPETETEAYTEGEVEADSIVNLAVDFYNDFAKKNGLSIVQKMNKARKSKLKARMKDCGGIEGWKIAVGKIAESDFLMGKKTDWKASFDFLIQEKSFTKLMEDGYVSFKSRKGKNADADEELARFLAKNGN